MDEETKNIRNRIRETLQLISSKEAQIQYQSNVPGVGVSSEIFNQWEDWYYPDSPSFPEAFSQTELDALEAFNNAFENVSDSTPQFPPPISEFVETPEWKEYSVAAQTALKSLDPNDAD